MNCISISYKTAPVEIRAMFAFSREEQTAFYKEALANKSITECMVLSTCNRSEIYFEGTKESIKEMEHLIEKFKKVNLSENLKYFCVFGNDQAVRHAFMVTCGMESMVLGEDEILGQVKDAYQLALSEKATNFMLNTVFQNAINCSKRIKTDTNLSKTPVSIGTLVANEIFHFRKENDTDVKNVFIIGMTGKMGSIVMKNIYGKQNISITGSSRNSSNHLVKGYPMIKMVSYKDRYKYLEEADIVVSATTSPHYTVTCAELLNVITPGKKRLYIDLSVPSDMDDEIQSIEGIDFYNIDYFEELSKHNNVQKAKELERGKDILEEVLDETYKIVLFRNFLSDMPKVKKVFKENKFETIMYQLRDKENHESLAVVFDALKQLVSEEY